MAALLAVEAARLPGLGRDYAANVAAIEAAIEAAQAADGATAPIGREPPARSPGSGNAAIASRGGRAMDRRQVAVQPAVAIVPPPRRAPPGPPFRLIAPHRAVTPARTGTHRPDAQEANARRGGDRTTSAGHIAPLPVANSANPGAAGNTAVPRALAGAWEGAAPPPPAITVPSSPSAPRRPAPGPARSATAAFDLAAAAYAGITAGDRRAAAQGFGAALAADPAHPNAAAWRAARAALVRRWSGDAYALLRDAGNSGGGALAASPVLGGGQAGAGLAFTPDPLARRPLALVARAAIATAPAHGGGTRIVPRGLDSGTVQLALGLRWRPLPGVSITGERLIAAGTAARDDWTLRVAAGSAGKRGRAQWSAYGEAGVLGGGDTYAGGQGRAGLRLIEGGRISVEAGGGVWGSIQHSATTAGRLDAGPSLTARIGAGRAAFEVSADYRWRVAGNAAPGNGPAVTLSAAF